MRRPAPSARERADGLDLGIRPPDLDRCRSPAPSPPASPPLRPSRMCQRPRIDKSHASDRHRTTASRQSASDVRRDAALSRLRPTAFASSSPDLLSEARAVAQSQRRVHGAALRGSIMMNSTGRDPSGSGGRTKSIDPEPIAAELWARSAHGLRDGARTSSLKSEDSLSRRAESRCGQRRCVTPVPKSAGSLFRTTMQDGVCLYDLKRLVRRGGLWLSSCPGPYRWVDQTGGAVLRSAIVVLHRHTLKTPSPASHTNSCGRRDCELGSAF